MPAMQMTRKQLMARYFCHPFLNQNLFHNRLIYLQIIMNIASGNEERLFALQQINEWTAEIRVLRQLRGKHGNYSLILRAQDLGTPSHNTEGHLNICVTDYNDHAPMFISPPYNSTLRVPEVIYFKF